MSTQVTNNQTSYRDSSSYLNTWVTISRVANTSTKVNITVNWSILLGSLAISDGTGNRGLWLLSGNVYNPLYAVGYSSNGTYAEGSSFYNIGQSFTSTGVLYTGTTTYSNTDGNGFDVSTLAATSLNLGFGVQQILSGGRIWETPHYTSTGNNINDKIVWNGYDKNGTSSASAEVQFVNVPVPASSFPIRVEIPNGVSSVELTRYVGGSLVSSTITSNTTGLSTDFGSQVSVTATMKNPTGYTTTFNNWNVIVDGVTSNVSSSNPGTFQMNYLGSNISIIPDVSQVANTYTLALTTGSNVSSVSGDGNYIYGNSLGITCVAPQITGYTPIYTWTSNNNSLFPTFTTNFASTNISMPAGNVRLTASADYTINTYNIVPVAGSNVQSVSGGGVVTYNDPTTVSCVIYNNTGYTTTFTKWSSSNTFAIPDGYTQSYTITNIGASNVTLVASAQSVANTYTIVYNNNGGSGSMTSQSMTYDVAANLTTNAFTWSGYTFVGWSTNSADTSPLYTDGQSVKNLSSVSGESITLYAIWSANTYTVAFNGNEGVVQGNTSKNVVMNNTYGEFPSATRSGGYIFLGWSTTKDDSTTQVYEYSTFTSASNITLYALWDGNARNWIDTGTGYKSSNTFVWDSTKNIWVLNSIDSE